MFQSLLGRLKTKCIPQWPRPLKKFQSLLGRLKTMLGLTG